MKTKLVEYISLVDVEVTELQKMLKSISLPLEKIVDTTLHFRGYPASMSQVADDSGRAV
jgi:hypothetical protein